MVTVAKSQSPAVVKFNIFYKKARLYVSGLKRVIALQNNGQTQFLAGDAAMYLFR